jgi:hypothetical protein
MEPFLDIDLKNEVETLIFNGTLNNQREDPEWNKKLLMIQDGGMINNLVNTIK